MRSGALKSIQTRGKPQNSIIKTPSSRRLVRDSSQTQIARWDSQASLSRHESTREASQNKLIRSCSRDDSAWSWVWPINGKLQWVISAHVPLNQPICVVVNSRILLPTIKMLNPISQREMSYLLISVPCSPLILNRGEYFAMLLSSSST